MVMIRRRDGDARRLDGDRRHFIAFLLYFICYFVIYKDSSGIGRRRTATLRRRYIDIYYDSINNIYETVVCSCFVMIMISNILR